jgi:ABC-type Fe3+/spermidine/putrescine transport system ATPase subunit
MSMADKVIVMSDAMVQQIGTSREIHENPRNQFVADFIGNNNMFKGTIRSRSGSMVFVEAGEQLYYIRVPDHIRQVTVGREVHFSVRADLMHTGDNPEMANKVRGSYVATEFLGTLETDVFEVGPNHFVHVEQHRHLSDTSYKVGEMETLCFTADSGMLLAENRRPEDVTG